MFGEVEGGVFGAAFGYTVNANDEESYVWFCLEFVCYESAIVYSVRF